MVEAVESFLVLQVATDLPDVVTGSERHLIWVAIDQAKVRHRLLREG